MKRTYFDIPIIPSYFLGKFLSLPMLAPCNFKRVLATHSGVVINTFIIPIRKKNLKKLIKNIYIYIYQGC